MSVDSIDEERAAVNPHSAPSYLLPRKVKGGKVRQEELPFKMNERDGFVNVCTCENLC